MQQKYLLLNILVACIDFCLLFLKKEKKIFKRNKKKNKNEKKHQLRPFYVNKMLFHQKKSVSICKTYFEFSKRMN